MYQALYRKWRPQRFDEVIGQSHITDTLQNQLRQGRVAHAYLFTGTRGTGKTTCAKLLARAVNCESPENGNPCNRCSACTGILSGAVPEVLELDAASNTGVDNMRGLLEEVIYPPVEVKKRVYIIDEVHMLSIGAFNALLKTLEEPPPHILFILATTELHKVPATILSRCQRFDFRRVDMNTLAANLSRIAEAEHLALAGGAAALLARLADGSVRDSLSLLERCIAEGASGKLDEAAIYTCLGLSPADSMLELAEAVARQDAARALTLIDALYRDGRDMRAVLDSLAALLRDLLVLKTAGKSGDALVRTDDIKELHTLASLYTLPRLLEAVRAVQETINRLQRSNAGRLEVELCIIKLCEPVSAPSAVMTVQPEGAFENKSAVDALIARVAELEAKYGTPVQRPTDQDTRKEAPVGPSKEAYPSAKAAAKPEPAKKPADIGLKGLPPEQCEALFREIKGKVAPSVLTHMRLSKIECSDGALRILVDDEMSDKLLSEHGVKIAVCEAAEKLLGGKLRVLIELEQEDGGFGGFDSIMDSGRSEGIAVHKK